MTVSGPPVGVRPVPPPLEGVKVLDLSPMLAGPFCGAWLGDMGAGVVKIEDTTAGDELRRP